MFVEVKFRKQDTRTQFWHNIFCYGSIKSVNSAVLITSKEYSEWNVILGPNIASLYRLNVARHPSHYDFLNDVAFVHKELWQTLVADSLSVTSQMLWHLATTNYGDIWPCVASL